MINWGDEPITPNRFDTGFYPNIENDVYRKAEGVSKSEIAYLAQSASAFMWSKNAPVDTTNQDALVSGSALHCAVLEPSEFGKRYTVAPKFDLRTNAGKQANAEWLDSVTSGVISLDAELHRKIMLMRDSVYAHPFARSLLEICNEAELSGFFKDPETGEHCKFRADKASRKHNIICDLKQTADFDKFDRVVEQFMYQLQDAWYSFGWQQITGEFPDFYFIVVSSTISAGRYPVEIYQLDLEQSPGNRISREDGLLMMRQLLNEYHERKLKNDWLSVKKLVTKRFK